MAITHTHQGNFPLALEHCDKALALYGSDNTSDTLFVDALNPGVALRCFGGWCLWFTGYPVRALVRIQEAVALARRLSEPHGLAHALFFTAVLHQLRRERAMAQQCADDVLVLASDHGLVLYGAAARIVRGWALIGRGDDADAAEQMREGLAAWHGIGADLMRPHFLTLLAEAYATTNRHAQALSVLDEALTLAKGRGEGMYEAEVRRLRGEHLLAAERTSADVEAAATCFEEALAFAGRQGARSLELRAATSLARLHRDRATRVRARDLILPIYEQFDEGFDTLDLTEARNLVEQA